MSRQINFLAERRKQLTKTERQDRRIMRIASIVFGVIFFLFLIVFAVRLYVNRQLMQVREAQRRAREQVVGSEATERSFVIFVNKLTALVNVTNDRDEKNKALTFFSTIFGSEVFIRQISFLEKERILSLTVQSDTVFQLQRVFAIINSPEVRNEFVSISPSNLARSPQGDYELVITAVVKETGASGATGQ